MESSKAAREALIAESPTRRPHEPIAAAIETIVARAHLELIYVESAEHVSEDEEAPAEILTSDEESEYGSEEEYDDA